MVHRLRILLPLLCWAPTLRAQSVPLPPLAFLGFEAGQSLDTVGKTVRALGGRGLRCDRSRRDRTVLECRASVVDPVSRRAVDLWLSAIDSATGVMTLSSPVSGVELDSWRSGLENAFGVVDANVQGSQWMLQWVRQGTMLRLTWRIDKGAKVASVSLVDGHVLDGWGRRRDNSVTPTKVKGEK